MTSPGPRSELRCALIATLALAAACAPETPPGLTPPDAGAPDAVAPDAAPRCALVGDPRFEDPERSCDGVDNDCDEHVDLLLPIAENTCTASGARGACAAGYYGCIEGRRACLTPPPTPEVADGIDNDCDGAIDEAEPGGGPSRMTLLMPRYLWAETATQVVTIEEILRGWGVAVDLPSPGSDWDATLADLDRYAVAMIPAYFIGEVLSEAERAVLERWVSSGGVLVVIRPVIGSSTIAGALTGLRSSERRFDLREIAIDAPSAAFAAFDAPEERVVPVTDNVNLQPIEVYALTPTAGTTTVATSATPGGARFATITRRPLGRGAVYSLGHDFLALDHYRCYINCFEPGRDLLALFLKGAIAEATGGHTVFVHTMPGAEDSLLLLTHDVDAPDAQQPGPWGAPGARQLADVERAAGAVGTYYVTTDYVTPYFNEALITELCALGMCPIAAHSVLHAANFDRQAIGDCAEDAGSYLRTPTSTTTLCGEIKVASDLLERATGTRPRAWRTPYLYVHPELFRMLVQNGFTSDSSFAIGDFKLSLPFSTKRIEYGQWAFKGHDLHELLITLEDGIGYYDTEGNERRIELQPSNLLRFVNAWRYVLIQNAHNRAPTVALIHPSYGIGVGPENLPTKVEAARRLLADATAAGVRADLTADHYVDFWRARAGVALDARFSGDEYQVTLTTGPLPVDRLVLELGDRVVRLDCPACAGAEIAGSRLVLRGLPASSQVELRAYLR